MFVNEFDEKELEKTEEDKDSSIVIENEVEEISPEEVSTTLENVELEQSIQPQNMDSSVEDSDDSSSSSNGPEEENDGDGSCSG